LASVVTAAEAVAREPLEARCARESAGGWADLPAALERVREPAFPDRVLRFKNNARRGGSVRYENLVLLPADSARANLPWEK
jgi:hypothetical protein